MSSFIVEDKTINRIVSFCFWENDSILKGEIQRELKEVGIDLNKYFKNDFELDAYLKSFAEELLKLNCMAVYDRYNKSVNEIGQEIKEAIKSFKYEDVKRSERQHIQVLKSIECFLYQCSEGEIDKLPLFLALRKIAEHLQSHIINQLPEYQNATWG